ncbi:MAG TPA: hypothetical protein VG096_06560 [Bryobacteraceae bacterium]|jgi:hypothetical protein|nr:hypothetical protein [Bryobacteraceae bacterium]
MKREAVGHTKMKRLLRRLDIPLYQGVGLLECLWHVTAREAPRGDIGKLSDEDIALAIDYRGDEARLMDSLIASGWVDRDPVERLVVHGWADHCEDAVHMRLARARLHFVGNRAPKLSKLTGRERDAAHEYYTACALESAHGSSGPCAHTDYPSAPPLPTPKPLPSPKPRPTTTSVVGAARSEYPATERAIAHHFQSGDGLISAQVVDLSIRAYLSVKNPKIPTPMDDDIAAAVDIAHREATGQKSAGLFKTTVPNVIRGWATHGRRPPNVSAGAQEIADMAKGLRNGK